MRVLHIFSNPHLTNGAAVFEQRISSILKEDGIYFDYLVTEQATEEELERYRANGSQVFRLPIDHAHGLLVRELRINRAYYRFFREHPYEIVYADTENALRAVHLFMARLAGVPVRVVHSHNTGLQTESRASAGLSRLIRRGFRFSATDYFACSEAAAEWLFPPAVCRKHQYRILKNGVDLREYSFQPAVRQAVRKQLQLEDQIVIGNIGRFMPQKNHSYLLDIFAAFHRRVPESRLLLVGDGPLRAETEAKASALGLRDAVLMVGNVPEASSYLQAMDLFLMPSLFEGLPITGIEAQAAGLPCLFAGTITRELQITEPAEYCALEEPPEVWAEKMLLLLKKERKSCEEQITAAGYSIQDTAACLRDFYLSRGKET